MDDDVEIVDRNEDARRRDDERQPYITVRHSTFITEF